jgi:threonine synthase
MNEPILYDSTNLNTPPVTFRQALLKGLAPDKGLYMPQRIPSLAREDLQELAGHSYADIAFAIGRKFLSSELADDELRLIVDDAYNFPVPLEQVTDRRYVMRLDQGPTASFKDFAARMMGRLMQSFVQQEQRELLILTATSGDTGSAIANAFYGLDNIRVIVLFPETEVTDRQRKQMTTLHDNIQIIALDGKFDDCQALVKRAFADPDLADLPLSSANSINIGRLLPQTIYYVYAYAQLAQTAGEELVFSVPSGNFGNLMGGLIAHTMGLPIKRFVVATNENDEFPQYVMSELYHKIVPSINCISSAMNVGHPSNVARLIALYGGQMDEQGNIRTMPDIARIRRNLYATSVTDDETRATIRQAYEAHGLLLEPHGAVGWAALLRYLDAFPDDVAPDQVCVSLETAHPAKFPQEIRKILGFDPELPPSLEGLDAKPEHYDHLTNDYAEFKQYLRAF